MSSSQRSIGSGRSSARTRESHSTTEALPEAIAGWIESETGGRIVAVERSGGGASRRAWAVDVALVAEGNARAGVERSGALACSESTLALFCLCDDPGGAGGSLRDAAVLRALAATAIPVPRVLAASASHAALLLERIEGRSDFPAVDREEEREPTARDLMRLTAALHALDPAALAIAHLGPPSADRARPAGERLVELAALLERLGADAVAVQRFAADWLARHPPSARRTSLVHSDMGPGNFLAAGGRVTAILDWEVAHWGDPMEDLAAIAVRDMATPVGPLAQRLAEYAAAGGGPIDLAAIAWYRVFILARNTALIALRLRGTLDPAVRAALERFQLLLLRALALCLCDGVGADRPDPDSPIAMAEASASPAAVEVAEALGGERARAVALAAHYHARAGQEGERFAAFVERLPQRLPSA